MMQMQLPSLFICSLRDSRSDLGWFHSMWKQPSHERCSTMSPLAFQCCTGTQKDFLRPGAGFQGDGVPQPHSWFAMAPAAEAGVGVKVPELKEFHGDKRMQPRHVLLWRMLWSQLTLHCRGRDAVVDIICKLLPRCFKPSFTVRCNLTIAEIYMDRYYILVFVLLHGSQGGSRASVRDTEQESSPLRSAMYICKALP